MVMLDNYMQIEGGGGVIRTRNLFYKDCSKERQRQTESPMRETETESPILSHKPFG